MKSSELLRLSAEGDDVESHLRTDEHSNCRICQRQEGCAILEKIEELETRCDGKVKLSILECDYIKT